MSNFNTRMGPVVPACSKPEKVFVVFTLVLSSQAFLNVFGLNEASQHAGMIGMQVLWSVIYAFTFMLLYKHRDGLGSKLKREFWTILLACFALSSAFWSGDPYLTVRRGIALVCTVMFGVYFAHRFSLKQQLRLLATTYVVVIVFSIVFELFGWGTAVDIGVPGWIGVFPQKNTLGMHMAFAAVVFFIVRQFDSQYKSRMPFGTVISFVLLILARSASAVVMLMAAMPMFGIRRELRKGYRTILMHAVVALPVVCYSVLWAFRHLDAVTGLLGKDPMMTGRVPIWILSVVMALNRPWLGYGYNAFWLGSDGPSAGISRLLRWNVPSAHNSLLDVWLGLGLAGVIIFVVGFAVYMRRAIRLVRRVSAPEACWPLICLTMTFVVGLVGSAFFIPNSILTVMYVSVGVTSAQVVGPVGYYRGLERKQSD